MDFDFEQNACHACRRLPVDRAGPPLIENFMYFGLGALLTGIVALLFLPLFWRRAVRLSTRSLEMRLPLSMTEIVAERDQLRAEFAGAAASG